MVSIITETTINKLVPPKAKVLIPVTFVARKGSMAINPKNDPPTKVILFKMKLRKSAVAFPGLIPGIKTHLSYLAVE